MRSGRPTIDPSGDKHFLAVQVSRDAKERVAAYAAEYGVAPAQYTRMIIYNKIYNTEPLVAELRAEIERLNIILAEKSR